MVKYKRNLPKGGASSVVTLGGAVVLFCFGMYKVIEANKLRRCNQCPRGVSLSLTLHNL